MVPTAELSRVRLLKSMESRVPMANCTKSEFLEQGVMNNMSISHMNSWMVPKNKRTLYHIPDTLFLFVSKIGGQDWTGDRPMQRRFEEMLEEAGLKAEGQPYDPNSGGARTYKAQLECLGLLFLDDKTNPSVYRPTLAGEEILEGENPWPILRQQLLKFQYPSPYSLGSNVKIHPEFQIRPFYFLLKLLNDENIGHLSKEEVAKIVIVYGRTEDSYEEVKQMILDYRIKQDQILPDSFMRDSSAPRIKGHDIQDRFNYLKDKANIFFNYLESTRLVIRPDTTSKIEINPDMRSLLSKFEQNNYPLIDYPEDQYRFQRKYGLPPGKSKDTRKFKGGSLSKESIKERIVMKTFYERAKTNLVLELDDGIIDRVAEETSVPRQDVAKILERKSPEGLDYFEERYLDMASKGREESREFEKATAEIFETAFNYISKHIGDISPRDRKGGNPDVLIISEDAEYCAIIDAKAYFRYSISNDHHNRMLNNYIPNYEEHVENKSLEFFLYVSGGFSRNFSQQVEELANESDVDGAGISAKSLLNLTKLATEESLDHFDLKKVFSRNEEVTVHNTIV